MSFVYYWTDSASSQYRSKHTFNTILQHESLFNTKAAWNYFEVNHGKGLCDGLGATAKEWVIIPLNNASMPFKML